MTALVVRALDNSVLGEFSDTFTAEGVTTGERSGLFVVVIVGLEANATLEDGCFHCASFRLGGARGAFLLLITL